MTFRTQGLLWGAGAAALLAGAPVRAAEAPTVSDLVITATLDDSGVRRDLVGGSVTVLTPDMLDQRGTRMVSDVLRDVPGVAVSRSGCIGCAAAVRLRGAETNHTLVLVDGVNFASPVSREVDFATLQAEDGARIEVLRGQQSALYGSEAIGGVIQYFTPDGRTAPGVRVRAEAGSFGTFAGGLQAGGANDIGDVIVSFTGYDTDGTENTRSGTRDLGYWNYTLSAKGRYALADNLRLIGVVRGNKSRSEFNSRSNVQGELLDSPGNVGRTRNLIGRAELQGEVLEGRWTHSVAVEGLDAKSTSTSFSSRGKRVKGAYVTTLTFGDDAVRHKLTGSADYQHETFAQDFDPTKRSLNTTGLVAAYDLTLNGATALGASIRNDSNNRFEDFTSYRVQATHRFPTGTRLRAAAGSGIQYPTQFELFGFSGNFRPNPALKPEKSEGWEAGVEQAFGEGRVLLGATYFRSRLTDKISSTGFPISTPVNLAGKAHQEGVETFAELRLDGGFDIDAAYTWLDSKDGSPPTRTVRRARSIASLNGNWTGLEDRLRLNLNVRYNGAQKDNRFPSAPPFVVPVRLDAYTVVNANAEYRLNPAVTLFARADNLLDESYEEVWSYVAPGREVTAGIKARF